MCPLQQQQQQQQASSPWGAQPGVPAATCVRASPHSVWLNCSLRVCVGAGAGQSPPHFVLKTLHSLVTPSRSAPAGVSGAQRGGRRLKLRQAKGRGPAALGGSPTAAVGCPQKHYFVLSVLSSTTTSRMYTTTKFLYPMTCTRGGGVVSGSNGGGTRP